MNDLILLGKFFKIYIIMFIPMIFFFILFYNVGVSANESTLLYVYFSVPFEEEVNYTITSKFGTRYDPFNKEETKFHSGIDVAAPKNTKILASADGIVHETGYNSSLGNYVYIKHNFDNVILFSIYGHLLDDSICVEEGENVSGKDEIAIIGSTGRSTGTHLHFTISKDKISFNQKDLIDPITIFQKEVQEKNKNE